MKDSDTDQDLTILCRISANPQAAMIQQALEDQAIPSFADGENANAIFTWAAMDIKILVRKCDWLKAIEVLRDIAEQTGQRIDIAYAYRGEPKCPKCGYILYYAKGNCCPECGRSFVMAEISLEKAKVVDGTLHPL